MPVTNADIATFLRTNPNIGKLNFCLVSTLRVYPTAYSKDVADRIDSGAIKLLVGKGISAGAGATYDMVYDTLAVSATFSVASPSDQAFLVHECTHAHIDIQNIGSHSAFDSEATAYLAEALFLEASAQPPLSSHKVRTTAQAIAKSMLATSAYIVAPADASLLVSAVKAEPLYAGRKPYDSNGFKRGVVQNLLR